MGCWFNFDDIVVCADFEAFELLELGGCGDF